MTTHKPPVNKNKRQKYDFAALKLEFFGSDFDEVKSFFQHKYNTYSSQVQHSTTGWTAEKKERKRQIVNEANKLAFDDEVRVKASALRTVLNSFLEDFKDKVIDCERCVKKGKIGDKVCPDCKGAGKFVTKFNDYPVKIRRMLWEIWRVENNLPTNLSKFQQLPGPIGESPLSEHTRKILQENGIDPDSTMA